MPPLLKRRPSNRSKDRKVPSIPLHLFFKKLLPALSRVEECPSIDDNSVASWATCFASEERTSVQYLLSEILSKFSDGSTSDATFAKAAERFWLAEQKCKETNEAFWSGRVRQSPLFPVIVRAREQMHGLLGESPRLEEVAKYFGWGPGATTRLPRRRADAAHKYSGKPETTAGNLRYAAAAVCSVPLWKAGVDFDEYLSGRAFSVVPGNKVITVPKNRRTDRCIAIEPDMNIYVQKGFGGVIRRLLRRWHVDLNDQSPNQRLALAGSIGGQFATIDLSMASDTVSRAIVEFLVPAKWVDALEQARSPFGFFEGKAFLYAKFSSMGNGFTFELESAIFCALCRACYRHLGIEGRPVVYGDDLIVDTRAYQLVVDVLELCGFSCNTEKSFSAGPFRESCGKHYLAGADVTPFYIRRPVKGLEEVILLHNNLWRWALRTGNMCDELRDVLSWIRSFAPLWLQKQSIPDGLGDVAFVSEEPQLARQRHPYQWEVCRLYVWSNSSREEEVDLPGLLIKALHRCETVKRFEPDGTIHSYMNLDDCLAGSAFPLSVRGYSKRKLIVHCSPHASSVVFSI